jgi:cathepsin D
MLLSIIIPLLLFPSLLVAAASPPPRRDPVHIPVLRRRHVRSGGEADLGHYANLAASLRRKYKYGPPVSRRAQTADINMTNQVSCISDIARPHFLTRTNNKGFRYKLLCTSQCRHSVRVVVENVFPQSHLLLALRSQSFDLVLDTGSSDLWFATTDCTSCDQGTPELDPTKSSSFKAGNDHIVMNYGSGAASGTDAQDTVSMGPFTVNPQTFGTHVPFSCSSVFHSSVGALFLETPTAAHSPLVVTGILIGLFL